MSAGATATPRHIWRAIAGVFTRAASGGVFTSLRIRLCIAAAVGTILLGSPLAAQALRVIGATAAGNPVLVETRSVLRKGTLVNAIVRVKFAKAVRAPGGDWWSSRTRLTFDCTKRQVKVLENWYYGDTTWKRIASRSAPGLPGFGTVMGGSMTSVAYDALCARQ